jgi:uncharacterized protein YjiS (DUF1127 family)
MNLLPTSEVTEAVEGRVPPRAAPRSHVRRTTSQGWLRVMGAWIERSRQRHALAELDGRLLKDIGVTRAQAAREIAKPFWR